MKLAQAGCSDFENAIDCEVNKAMQVFHRRLWAGLLWQEEALFPYLSVCDFFLQAEKDHETGGEEQFRCG